MKVLVIAPHPDDEIIGVGGTIAKRIKAGDEVSVCIVTKGQEPLFSSSSVEQVTLECLAAHKKLGVKETIFLDFPAAMLETVHHYQLNEKLLYLIQKTKPNDVYIPHKGDMHKDHQIVVDAVMVALRPKYTHVVNRVFAYETLSETGWNIPNVTNEFVPNVYEDITLTMKAKIDAMKIYTTQLCDFPNARSIIAIEALARYRGATINVMAAEAFNVIREINI